MMRAGSWQVSCEHDGDCRCAMQLTGTNQSLDELSFSRSACAVAQSGDICKLRRQLDRNPEAVHSDGAAGRSGYTPLHYAARAGRLGAAGLLLERGANVNAQTREGRATALHRAAGMGHFDVAQLLLLRGADAMLQDSDGEAALHKAAARGHGAVCDLLLQAAPGAALLVERHGRTPIMVAIGDAVSILASADQAMAP